MVKFARTGGEANSIAVRIARAASGRDNIAICGYHGWHDWYLSTNLNLTKNNNLNISKLNGKKLSYNNYNDIYAALSISRTLPKNTGTVIVKHANPCGVSINSNEVESYRSALKCDPISAYGGIVSCNFKINKKLATELKKLFLEVIIANGFNNDDIRVLKTKKNLRLVYATNYKIEQILKLMSFIKEVLNQSEDLTVFTKKNFKIVSKRKPTLKQLNDLIFAFNVCRYVKSNAIVIASNETTLGLQ